MFIGSSVLRMLRASFRARNVLSACNVVTSWNCFELLCLLNGRDHSPTCFLASVLAAYLFCCKLFLRGFNVLSLHFFEPPCIRMKQITGQLVSETPTLLHFEPARLQGFFAGQRSWHCFDPLGIKHLIYLLDRSAKQSLYCFLGISLRSLFASSPPLVILSSCLAFQTINYNRSCFLAVI